MGFSNTDTISTIIKDNKTYLISSSGDYYEIWDGSTKIQSGTDAIFNVPSDVYEKHISYQQTQSSLNTPLAYEGTHNTITTDLSSIGLPISLTLPTPIDIPNKYSEIESTGSTFSSPLTSLIFNIDIEKEPGDLYQATLPGAKIGTELANWLADITESFNPADSIDEQYITDIQTTKQQYETGEISYENYQSKLNTLKTYYDLSPLNPDFKGYTSEITEYLKQYQTGEITFSEYETKREQLSKAQEYYKSKQGILDPLLTPLSVPTQEQEAEKWMDLSREAWSQGDYAHAIDYGSNEWISRARLGLHDVIFSLPQLGLRAETWLEEAGAAQVSALTQTKNPFAPITTTLDTSYTAGTAFIGQNVAAATGDPIRYLSGVVMSMALPGPEGLLGKTRGLSTLAKDTIKTTEITVPDATFYSKIPSSITQPAKTTARSFSETVQIALEQLKQQKGTSRIEPDTLPEKTMYQNQGIIFVENYDQNWINSLIQAEKTQSITQESLFFTKENPSILDMPWIANMEESIPKEFWYTAKSDYILSAISKYGKPWEQNLIKSAISDIRKAYPTITDNEIVTILIQRGTKNNGKDSYLGQYIKQTAADNSLTTTPDLTEYFTQTEPASYLNVRLPNSVSSLGISLSEESIQNALKFITEKRNIYKEQAIQDKWLKTDTYPIDQLTNDLITGDYTYLDSIETYLKENDLSADQVVSVRKNQLQAARIMQELIRTKLKPYTDETITAATSWLERWSKASEYYTTATEDIFAKIVLYREDLSLARFPWFRKLQDAKKRRDLLPGSRIKGRGWNADDFKEMLSYIGDHLNDIPGIAETMDSIFNEIPRYYGMNPSFMAVMKGLFDPTKGVKSILRSVYDKHIQIVKDTIGDDAWNAMSDTEKLQITQRTFTNPEEFDLRAFNERMATLEQELKIYNTPLAQLKTKEPFSLERTYQSAYKYITETGKTLKETIEGAINEPNVLTEEQLISRARQQISIETNTIAIKVDQNNIIIIKRSYAQYMTNKAFDLPDNTWIDDSMLAKGVARYYKIENYRDATVISDLDYAKLFETVPQLEKAYSSDGVFKISTEKESRLSLTDIAAKNIARIRTNVETFLTDPIGYLKQDTTPTQHKAFDKNTGFYYIDDIKTIPDELTKGLEEAKKKLDKSLDTIKQSKEKGELSPIDETIASAQAYIEYYSYYQRTWIQKTSENAQASYEELKTAVQTATKGDFTKTKEIIGEYLTSHIAKDRKTFVGQGAFYPLKPMTIGESIADILDLNYDPLTYNSEGIHISTRSPTLLESPTGWTKDFLDKVLSQKDWDTIDKAGSNPFFEAAEKTPSQYEQYAYKLLGYLESAKKVQNRSNILKNTVTLALEVGTKFPLTIMEYPGLTIPMLLISNNEIQEDIEETGDKSDTSLSPFSRLITYYPGDNVLETPSTLYSDYLYTETNVKNALMSAYAYDKNNDLIPQLVILYSGYDPQAYARYTETGDFITNTRIATIMDLRYLIENGTDQTGTIDYESSLTLTDTEDTNPTKWDILHDHDVSIYKTMSRSSSSSSIDYSDTSPTIEYSSITAGTKVKVYVERVIDGDTIVVKTPDGSEYTVRVLGLDTPESTSLSKNKLDRFPGVTDKMYLYYTALQAKQYTKMLEGEYVWIETESKGVPVDVYDRLLAYVYFEDSDGNQYDLTERLISMGLARSSPYKVSKSSTSSETNRLGYDALETDAQTRKVGIWRYINELTETTQNTDDTLPQDSVFKQSAIDKAIQLFYYNAHVKWVSYGNT